MPLLVLMNSFAEQASESKVVEECVTKCSTELPACENCSQIQQCLHDKKSAICKQVCMQLQAHEHQETKFDPEESCFQKIRFGLEPEITIKRHLLKCCYLCTSLSKSWFWDTVLNCDWWIDG